ncbi:MAG: adenosylcobinamide-GDP ribazoletransferase, partial [Eubacteriales bacterium]|nr:adenosylcobinamide-GDP ribazoletransferase [Eubacteriales bacterium]
MKYIRGFLMAWGMFCWIPCPYSKWNEEERRAQLTMLPLLGAFMGAVCCLIWWPLAITAANPLITGALLSGIYLLMTGFIHLDGFMDCSDAVMPRHPEMAERQRILKDSTVGAFAVVSMVLMGIIFTAAWSSVAWMFSLATCGAFVMVFTLSRMVSVVTLMTAEPMSTSQYADGNVKDKSGVDITVAILTGAFFVVLAMVTSRGNAFITSELPGPLAIAIIAAVTVLSGLLVGLFDRKKLGGMNGDVSGHMITVSEMCGRSEE